MAMLEPSLLVPSSSPEVFRWWKWNTAGVTMKAGLKRWRVKYEVDTVQIWIYYGYDMCRIVYIYLIYIHIIDIYDIYIYIFTYTYICISHYISMYTYIFYYKNLLTWSENRSVKFLNVYVIHAYIHAKKPLKRQGVKSKVLGQLPIP